MGDNFCQYRESVGVFLGLLSFSDFHSVPSLLTINFHFPLRNLVQLLSIGSCAPSLFSYVRGIFRYMESELGL